MEAGDGKYREKYTVYVDRYGTSERTVKRWVAQGKKAGVMPPLDDVERMREWWAQVSPHRCPDKLLVAAMAAVPVAKRGLPAAPLLELPVQKPKKEEPVAVPRALREVGEQERGTEASLARLKEAEVHAHEIYLEALRSGKDAQAKLALKSFADLSEQVAKLEGIVEARRIKNRDLIPRMEAETLLGDFHQEFMVRLRGFGDQVLRRYGIPATAENEAGWQELVDVLCTQLQQEVFAG